MEQIKCIGQSKGDFDQEKKKLHKSVGSCLE